MLPVVLSVSAIAWWLLRPVPLPEDKPSLTLYFSMGCKHCVAMLPEWMLMPSNHKGIVIRSVEAKKISDEYPIKAFPTIIYRTAEGGSMEYTGARDKNSIIEFLDSQL